MTTSYSRRCWNALYMYEVDLRWVWSEWGATMVIYSMLQVRNRENHLLPLLLTDPAYIRLALHPYEHWPQNMIQKHFIYVCKRSDVSVKWVGYFNHLCYKWESERITYHWGCDWETKHLSGWGCMLMTTGHCSRCWNTLYMNEVDLIWVWIGLCASFIT
jgi:hypothetical protein